MVVTITSLELRSLWGFFRLSWHGLMISRQAKSHAGFIAMKNTGFGRLHYTVSAWESEDHLRAFARSGAHRDAMKESRSLSTEIRTFTFAADALPAWSDAKRMIVERGKSLSFD